MVMRSHYSQLWGHTIDGYGGTLLMVMGSHYSQLWGHTIDGYGVTLFIVMGHTIHSYGAHY